MSESDRVRVEVTSVRTTEDPPSTAVEYAIANTGGAPVWVVDDGFLTWRQVGVEVTLSFGRAPMQPNVRVFGYFDPAVVRLDAGASLERSVSLRWPLTLDQTWNAEAVATPEPGDYALTVCVGFGLTLEPPTPQLGEGVEAPVLRWQQETCSAPVPLRVPVYET